MQEIEFQDPRTDKFEKEEREDKNMMRLLISMAQIKR